MEKSRNILAWLGQKEEQEILNDALKHVEKVFECVKEMKEVLQAFSDNDMEKKNQHISNVKEAEHQGDEIRKKIMVELSKGLFFPPDREDLILLNESLNDIADGAKGVARLLEFFGEKPSGDLSKILLSDGIIAVSAAEKLKFAINALKENDVQKVLEECAHIETLEEEGDDKRRELIGCLVKTEFSPPLTLLIYETIDTLECVIDGIKRAGDMVRLLAIKAR